MISDKIASIISYRLLIVFILIRVMLLPGNVQAQEVSIGMLNLPEHQTLSMITDMDQDEFGYLWFATHSDGIIRYDGHEILSYQPQRDDIIGVSSFHLETIEIDNSGMIWVGDYNNGLYRFNPHNEEFSRYVHDENDPHSLHRNDIRSIFQDSRGTLWIGTLGGLDTLDQVTGKFYPVTGLSDDAKFLGRDHIRVIYEDRIGTIWFGCGSPIQGDNLEPDQGGLYKLDKSSGLITRYRYVAGDPTSLINNNVTAIFEDSRGVFWVGTGGDGLHTMDRKSGTFIRHTTDPDNPSKLSRPNYNPGFLNGQIRVINEDSKGFIWIGTLNGGLNRYNPESKTVEYFGRQVQGANNLEREDHWASLVTNEGILWISGSWINLNRNHNLYNISYNSSGQLSHDFGSSVICFRETTDGILWLGTEQGLIRRNDSDSHSTFLVNEDLNSVDNVIIDIEQGPGDVLYLSTVNGVFSFNRRTERIEEVVGPERRLTYDTYYREDNTLWIGQNNGLDHLDLTNGKLTHLHNATGDSSRLRNRNVYNIVEDDQKNIWICGIDGISRFQGDDFKLKTFFRNYNIGAVYVDEYFNVWAGSNHGLMKFDPGEQVFDNVVDSTQLLTDGNSYYGISRYRNNMILLKSNGIVTLDMNTLDATLLGESWVNAGNLSNRMVSISNSGEIMAGHANGYYSINPSQLEHTGYNPRPFISKFFIGNSEIDLYNDAQSGTEKSSKVKLEYDQNNISIEFDNIDFLSKGKEKNLTYKLQNYDREWQIKLTGQKAEYYNLLPGTYHFRIKASNHFGRMAESTLTIVVLPPWYYTWWAYLIYGLLFLLSVLSIHKIQKGRTIRMERARIQQHELEQAREIEKAYKELQNTQKQLIHAEKMASLGELSAGIAHEIQNPLNFVNNFSEVSKELVEEMNEELNKGDVKEAQEISKDIEDNLAKIHHHGKRASSIVIGMLAHSRTGQQKKEPTDINKLADEYLRLAYHGLRAKDKSFQSEFRADLDDSLPEINVIHQDIGRVLLNLINNAFYAVDKKAKLKNGEYKPEVVVRTKKIEDKVEVRVNDNGEGISEEIKEKIFQPFFSTKPTGQGTGLGLSLSYDIVKAHGGEIKVESREGNGTEFIIKLPNV